MKNVLIQLEHASKRYTNNSEVIKALDDVTLTIDKGDYLAVLGSSGSGKSTLMHVIGLLDSLDSGTFYFEDRLITEYQERDLALIRNEKIGFVFQSFYLIPYLTALKNVELPLIYSRSKISTKERRILAQQALDKVDLGNRLNHYPKQLSGGQQQRVAIARAIVNEPKILLADEPTGSLDSTNSSAIINLFENLNQQGVTLMIVTHDREIAKRSSYQLGIKDGKVFRI
jgi:putative ABC transport system ATP-binding protein